MSYNQNYGSGNPAAYKMNYNPPYVQPTQTIPQTTPHAYSAPPSYDFGNPYNKPLRPLTSSPSFQYQVPNNPYLEQNIIPQNQIVRPPPPVERIRRDPVVETRRTAHVKKKIVEDSRRSRVERSSNSTMNVDLPLINIERPFIDIRMRYPELYLPMDFQKATFHCLSFNTLPAISGGDVGSKIICDSVLGRVIPVPSENDSVSQVASLDRYNMKHNARVMLGFLDQAGDGKEHHIFNAFKFVVGKKERSSLLSLGGSWVKELDGDDPNEDSVLKNTVIRTVRQYCGLDLAQCQNWMKFIEIFYHRPSEVIDGELYPEIFERTVIFFIPDSKALFPKSHEEYASAVKNRLELIMKFEGQYPNETLPSSIKRMPKQPSLFLYTRKQKLDSGFKTITLSLDGLLDYNVDDRQEKTFEISLFAEALKEMLQKCHTNSIHKFLKKVIGKKRKREERKGEEEEGEGDNEGRAKKSKKRKLDNGEHPAYQGFKHFDKDSLGFVLVKDFEQLLLAKSSDLSQGDARGLVEVCADENNKKRIAYKTLEYMVDEIDDGVSEDELQDIDEQFKKDYQV